jgi:hypothetical protein
MMGGYGSGRPGWRPKEEGFRNIDVNRLRKAGLLKAGYSGGWQWTVDGEKVASISMRAETGRLVLIYRMRRDGGDWEDIEEPIPLVETDCTYGGTRQWFRCPGVRDGQWCARRVGKLYLGQRYFVCRHCLRLVYTSQSEQTMDRHNRRANKIRMALGAEPGTASLPPRKPKGMHWRTYLEKMDALDAADAAGNSAFIRWVCRRFPDISVDELLS